MSMTRHGGQRAASFAGVALAAIFMILPAQARVGVTSQTTNNPLGTPPAQQQRTLKVGIDVFANERIQTTANDRAHLLFLDGSSLTVGPNSDLLIDKFVFDPNTGQGELAVSATKGIFRLVGGKITKGNEATIKVGTSTIGIRGGITIVNAPECPPGTAVADCQAQAYFMFGQQLSVTNPNGSETATRPGSLIAFNGSAPPLPPVIAPPNSLVGPIGQLEAPSGQGNTGPAGPAGTIEQKTANSGLPPTNSGTPPDPVTGAPQTAQTANNVTGAGSALGGTPDPNTPPQNPPPPDNTPPPPPPPVVTTISSEGRFLREEPFSGWSIDAVSVSAPRDPLNNAFLQTATVTTAGGPVVTLVTDPGTLDVTTATGVTFSVPWSPGTGDIAVTNLNSSSSLGPVTGTGWVSPAGDFYVYNLREADDRGTGFFGGTLTPNAGLPTTGFAAREFFTLQASAPFLTETISAESVVATTTQGLTYIAWSPVLTPALASGNDQRATWFTATLNIQGQGEAQSSYLSIGTGNFFTDDNNAIYAAGGNQAFVRRSAFEGPIKFTTATATAETQTGTAIYSPGGEHMVLVPEQVTYNGEGTTRTPGAAYSLPFDTLMITDVHYPVVASRPAASPPPDVGTVRTAETLTGFAGALVENENEGWYSSYVLRNLEPGAVSITKSPTTNRVSGEFNLAQYGGYETDTTTLQWGSLSGNSSAQQSSFIDDKRFAMREAGSQAGLYDYGSANITTQMSMVTQAAVPDADFLPAGVSFCDCQYLTWGYWQADLNYQEGSRAGQRDYVTLGTWVVGTISANVDLPISGSATYSGHIIGNVENNAGNSYVAVGGFSNTWDFGTREGVVAITNFDGANYTGNTYGNPGNVNFSGNITGVGPASNRIGNLDGAFFRSPTDAAAYQAGSFQIQEIDANYKASGTFQAKRPGAGN